LLPDWWPASSAAGSAIFDFPAFKRALVTQDVAAWTAFYADDAEWLEYKESYPPRSPRRMRGKREIAEFLARVKSSNVELVIEDEVVGPDRAAFCLWCTLPDRRRIIEHIIIHCRDGRITRQVDVESWD
jgi:SnoaL-like domain